MSKENHKWDLRLTHKKDAHCNVNPQYHCGCFGDVFFNPTHKLGKRLRLHRKNAIKIATVDPLGDWTIPSIARTGNLRLGSRHRPSLCGSEEFTRHKII